jgi:hypothetical protein
MSLLLVQERKISGKILKIGNGADAGKDQLPSGSAIAWCSRPDLTFSGAMLYSVNESGDFSTLPDRTDLQG